MARPPNTIHSDSNSLLGEGVCEKGLTEFPESHACDLDSPPSKRVSFAFHLHFAVLLHYGGRALAEVQMDLPVSANKHVVPAQRRPKHPAGVKFRNQA